MDERYFRTVYMKEAAKFVNNINPIIRKRLLRKIERAESTKDSNAFKKLHDIWEFRIRYGFTQIRLLAFWDKSDSEDTLVLATHGFIKKTDKVPGKEIARAISIRNKYFDSKN